MIKNFNTRMKILMRKQNYAYYMKIMDKKYKINNLKILLNYQNKGSQCLKLN